MEEQRDVVIVGGGPAGAATAIALARRGRAALVLERAPAWAWRASGVFTSPVTVDALARLALTAAEIDRVARRIPAMRVETSTGTRFRLTYDDDGSLARAPVGLDRSALDPLLLERARSAGVDVRAGVAVRSVRGGRITLIDGAVIAARVVVGADGLRSVVARDVGVVRRPPLGDRVALTFHVEDPERDRPRDARMVTFDGGYVGLAPVPGGRVNVGIVLASHTWRERLRRDGATSVAGRVMAAIPDAADDPVRWRFPTICDGVEGAAPVGNRVAARSGREWLLVGDAAGFLDPFTGEGLHRALWTADRAVEAVDRHLAGDPDALPAYDRAVARRWRSKDAVSLLVQAFLEVPAAFDYAARRLADRQTVRETMGRMMGDLAPASTGLDPRFLAALLRP